VNRTLNGIKFDEIDYHAIAGIFITSTEMAARVEEDWKKYNAMQGK
jgi:hypothetical protein